MTLRSRTLRIGLGISTTVLVFAGCGEPGTGGPPGATGGAVNLGTGGASNPGSGGSISPGSGGLGPAVGGALGSGGSIGAGGTAPGTGGASAGGTTSSGGGSSVGGSLSSGGTGTGGSDPGTGGASTGGAGSGGAGTGGGSSSALADQYPCDGTTAGYDVVMTGDGNNWTITGGGGDENITTGMQNALVEAYSRLSGSAADKGTLLVQGDGTIAATSQVGMPSNAVLNFCGNVEVTGTPSGSDRSPFYGRDDEYIDIPHLSLTGNAQYGMFFRDVSNLHLGDIYINGTDGHGIRIDSHGTNDRNNASNIALDYIHVENTGGDGIEIYGAVGIEIGTVFARSTGDNGLILNDSIDANIGLVDAVDAAHLATGYAAFRTANDNGRYDNGTYPTNIRLGELRASGSNAGRGYFCVSGSGGVEIENFTIEEGAGDPAIFIENCYNVTLASASGSGSLVGGRGYIGHNAGNGDASSDVTFQNITLSGGAFLESNSATCGNGNQAINVTGGSVDICE